MKTYRGYRAAILGLMLTSAVLATTASQSARADDFSLGVAIPGASLYLGQAPRYYYAPPVVVAPPPRPVYYVAPPAPGYYVVPEGRRWKRHGPPPWAGRWHHEEHWGHWDGD